MKHSAIAIIALMLLPAVAFGKKEKKQDKKEPPHEYVVKMNDGTMREGRLSQDWVRWPAKSVNENFKITSADGVETQITVNEIDTIMDVTSGEKFIGANLPVPKLGKAGRIVKWISKCGPKSDHGEIISYVAWFSFSNGTHQNWELGTVHCMRFENDSIAYPFYYPPQNGEYNTSIMKKFLKDVRPEAVEYINRYFKANKQERKQLPEHPELFLNVYEEYLESLKQ